jgi:iron complex outermembrane receptor protein
VVISQFFDEFDQKQFTQELQLLGSSDRVNWILGAYYFDEDGFNANLLDFAISSFRSGGSFENKATALYAQGTYDVSDKFSATLGLRYTKEDKSFTPDQIIFNNPFAGSGDPSFDVPFLQAGERVLPFVEKTIEIKETSPFVNLAYQINDNMLAYATYSKGFKSGGFTQRVFPPIVAGFTAPAGTPDVDLIPTFDPEFVTVTELGFKFASDDNRLVINGAIFSTDYKDLQVQVFEGVAPVTKNAGQASLSGFEVETQYIPGGGWFVSAGLGYIDAEYDEIDVDTLFSANNDFERVPEWTASASVSKEFILKGGAVLLPRLDWSYRSETFNDTFNTAIIAQDGYSTVNGSIAWLSSNEKLRLTLGVTNLTDEEYLVTGVAGDAFQSFEGLYARQREWYAAYSYDF